MTKITTKLLSNIVMIIVIRENFEQQRQVYTIINYELVTQDCVMIDKPTSCSYSHLFIHSSSTHSVYFQWRPTQILSLLRGTYSYSESINSFNRYFLNKCYLPSILLCTIICMKRVRKIS